MLLKYFSLSKSLAGVVLVFVFLKIYQHNLVIKLSYERQRIEKRKMQLEKEQNDCSVELFSLLDSERVFAKIKDEWGMKPLKMSQIRAVPPKTEIDFLRATSTSDVLKKMGLYDLVRGFTGR